VIELDREFVALGLEVVAESSERMVPSEVEINELGTGMFPALSIPCFIYQVESSHGFGHKDAIAIGSRILDTI
jgi:hypothetical protein